MNNNFDNGTESNGSDALKCPHSGMLASRSIPLRLYHHWVDETRMLRTAEGTEVRFRFRLGSNESRAAAEEKAEESFRAAERFLLQTNPTDEDIRTFRSEIRRIRGEEADGDDYRRPICEEILRELDLCNVVTRNHYGAEVLNSTTTCFIDIDSIAWTPLDILRNIFGSYGVVEKTLATAEKLAAKPENAELGFRVYRTSAGMRVIVTGQGLEPGSERVHQLFAAFHADTRYAHLCDLQKCFRARLTPKPFRLRARNMEKLGRFPAFPYANEIDRQEAESWVADYNGRSERYAVCSFLKSFGRPAEDPIVAFHDEATHANERKPLA